MLIFALGVLSACRSGGGQTAPVSPPAPYLVLNPGAHVRVTRESGAVTGYVQATFTMDSASLAVCSTEECAAADSGRVVIPVIDMEALDVWGTHEGAGAYGGIFGGMLTYLLVRRPEDGADALMFVAGLAGGFLGWFVGSKVDGWVSVFPCYHGCAAGVYPEQPGM